MNENANLNCDLTLIVSGLYDISVKFTVSLSVDWGSGDFDA